MPTAKLAAASGRRISKATKPDASPRCANASPGSKAPTPKGPHKESPGVGQGSWWRRKRASDGSSNKTIIPRSTTPARLAYANP